MKPKKDDTSFWDGLRGYIHSRIGGLVIGEDVYSHGYSILHDLIGNSSFMQVYILNITGKQPEKRLAKWVEAFFILMSYPDSRIWCNQIASLAGALASSPVSAVCAGILSSDSRLYGPGVVHSTASLLLGSIRQKKAGFTDQEILNALLINSRSAETTNLSGFSRPIARGDERVVILEKYASSLGFKRGDYQDMAFAIGEMLSERKNENINLGGYSIAFLLDQKFSPDEIYNLCAPIVQSGVLACYVQSKEDPSESFYPLRCDDIEYQGKLHRPVPQK